MFKKLTLPFLILHKILMMKLAFPPRNLDLNLNLNETGLFYHTGLTIMLEG
jgi:hypothetical protein